MILRSWLDSLFGRLTASRSTARGRLRAKQQTVTPACVELLEGRRMLAAVTLFPNGSNTNGTVRFDEEVNLAEYPGSNPNPNNLDSNGKSLNGPESNGIPNTSGFSEPAGTIVAFIGVQDTFTNGVYVTGTQGNFVLHGSMQINNAVFNDAYGLEFSTFYGEFELVVANPYAVMGYQPYGDQETSVLGSAPPLNPTAPNTVPNAFPDQSIVVNLQAFDNAAPQNTGTGSITVNLLYPTSITSDPESTTVAPVIPQFGNGTIGPEGDDGSQRYNPVFSFNVGYSNQQYSYPNGGDTSLIANNIVLPASNNTPVPLDDVQPYDGTAFQDLGLNPANPTDVANYPNTAATTDGDGVNVLNVGQFAATGTVVGQIAAYDEDRYQESVLTYSFPDAPGTVGGVPGQTVNGVFVPAFSLNSFTGVITVNDPTYLNVLARSNAATNTAAQGIYGDLGADPLPGAVSNYPGGYSDVVFAVQVRATNGSGVYSQTNTNGTVTDSWLYIRLLDTGLVAPDVSMATKTLSVQETAPSNYNVGFFDLVDPDGNNDANAIPDYYTALTAGNTRIAQNAANIYLGVDPTDAFALAEPEQRMSYSIVGGNTPIPGTSTVPFAIDPDTGAISVTSANVLQYSALDSYNLQIKVTSDNPDADSLQYNENSGLTAMQDVLPLSSVATVRINVVAEPRPTLVTGNTSPGIGIPATTAVQQAVDNWSIPEGSANGLVVGTVNGSNVDTQSPYGQGVLSYAIIPGGTIVVNGHTYPSSSIFAINSINGIVSVDNTTASLGSVPALTNAQILNYLNQQKIPLTVQVTDTNPLLNPTTADPTATDAITVTLTKYDAIAPTVTNGSATIPEHSPIGTVVAQVAATPGQTDFPIASFSILTGNTVTIGGTTYTIFSINNSGQIIVNDAVHLNYYLFPTFNLVIQATDAGGLTGTGNFTINVSYVPEPIVMANQSTTLAEALPFGTTGAATVSEMDQGQTVTVTQGQPIGTFVYQMIATDAENPTTVANIKSFAINGGNFGGAFAIDQFGNVTVANPAALNYDANTKFVLSITVTENSLPAYQTTAQLTINLTAVHEPPIVSAQTFSVAEHSLAGSAVGTVTAAVHASIGAPLTYAITGGNSSGAFTINPTTGVITVTDPHLIDFNTTPVFNLQIMVTDSAASPLSSTVTDTINLIKKVSAPHLTGQSVTISEGLANGTNIGVTENETGGQAPLSYSIISGNTSNAFSINSLTGAITVNNSAALVYTINPTFALKVLVQDAESPKLGDTATITVNLLFVDKAPVLTSLETTPLNYTENISSYAQVPLTATIVPTDVDSPTMQSATIQITNNYQTGQDQLLFVNTTTPKIQALWNATTGTLTLFGVDTLAHYQTALRNVTYINNSHNPSALTRTVTFNITDSNGPLTSLNVTRQINVIPVNNPPTLKTTTPNLGYTEGTGAQPINLQVSVSDPDNTTLASGTVTLNNAVAGDTLGFVPIAASMGNIAGVLNSTGTVLSLTSAGATATLAQWQVALRAVTFTSLTGVGSPPNRSATFVVNDGQSVNGNSAGVVTTINIIPVFAPTLSNFQYSSFVEHNNPVAIDPVITVGNPSNEPLSSAKIVFTAGTYVSGQDNLGFTNNGLTMGNIAVQSNTGTTLTLVSTGATATVAQWQAALRAVTYYNPSFNPNTNTRSATFTLTDTAGINATSNGVMGIITVTATNDPPALVDTLDTGDLSYTEYSAPVAILPNVLSNDPKNLNMTHAIVQITGNYNSSEDTLAFTSTATIKGSWNATTGVLTLTGNDTDSNYRAALRSITYYNQHDGSTAPSRIVSYTVYNTLGLASNTYTRTIDITTANSPPVLSGIESTTLSVKVNDQFTPFPPITSALTLTDYDTSTISSATVKISTGYNSAYDMLGFNIANTNIHGSWNKTTGTLTLSGNDSLQNYQAALQTVIYYNTAAPTGGLTRTISFTITDGFGLTSTAATRNLTLVPTVTPATVSTNSSGTLTYNEGNPATPIAPSLTIAEPLSPNMIGATVTISTGYIAGQDQLVYTKIGNINSELVGNVLHLYGADTLANYQLALESVAYVNSSSTPTASTKTISFSVTDGYGGSNTATQNVAVIPTVDPLVLQTHVTSPLSYSPTLGAVSVAPALTATDSSSTTISSATVQITFNYQLGPDVLSFSPTANISGLFNPATGTLTLSGKDTVANYAAALENVLYAYNGTPVGNTTKTLTYQAYDGTVHSNATTANIIVHP